MPCKNNRIPDIDTATKGSWSVLMDHSKKIHVDLLQKMLEIPNSQLDASWILELLQPLPVPIWVLTCRNKPVVTMQTAAAKDALESTHLEILK